MISFDDYLGKETLSGLWWKENIGTKLILGGGGLKQGGSEARNNGGPGARPRQSFT